MAATSSSMASVASSFVLTPIPSRSSSLSSCKANAAPGSRLAVVRAAAAPAAGEDGEVTAKSPKIGPKRGTKESYWYNAIGSVVTVDQDPATLYPVVVRFNRINYANISTNNYALDEVMEVN